MRFNSSIFRVALLGTAAALAAWAQPIAQHPANPHYFIFQGKPTILITSAEHYGAVLNLDFDYRKYLDALAAGGANYTRIYTGAFFEPRHVNHRIFHVNDSLGIADGRHCVPWARSSVPGYQKGGNKFDLDRWDPEFFRRLKDYVRYAGAKGIVVEAALYNAHKPSTWHFQPLQIDNNVNGVGNVGFADFQAIREPKLLQYQDAYVRKIVGELNEFDNVILEIIDEPTIGKSYAGTSGERATEWISHMIDTIVAAEAKLPRKHLIAQQVEGGGKPYEKGGRYGAVDFSADRRVPVIVGQYLWQNDNQVGAMRLLEQKYDRNKPVELNETQVYPTGYPKSDLLGASRVEAWEFIVSGGAGYNQLNGQYTAGNEDASGTDNAAILAQLARLRDFMQSFEFVRMRRDPKLLAKVPPGAFWGAIAEPGRQYALYLHHSRNPRDNDMLFMCYEVQPGDYQEDLELRLAPGRYAAEWVDPASGKVVQSAAFSHAGGTKSLRTPKYRIDVALRIKTAERASR